MADGSLTQRLVGFLFKRSQPPQENLPSFTPPDSADGAVTIQAVGGAYGSFVDMEGSVKTEAELVTRYRQLILSPEVNEAITQVVNDAVVDDDEQDVIALDIDEIEEIPANVKKTIEKEFEEVLKLMRFRTHPYEIFKTWYVDGRMYYHVIIDKDHPDEGVKEFRFIDPRKIRRIREVAIKRGEGGTEIYTVVNEYFVYNDRGFQSKPGQTATNSTSVSGVKIAKDAIIHATSGVVDETGTLVLGYLHPAIKYINQLRAIEDAVVIYRLVRAPERRVWEIDVGNLPANRAEAHIRDVMVRHKNRLVYDASTGSVRDDRRYMNLMDDFYLARRPDGSGNKVEVLQGGELTDRIADVEYFLRRVYKSLGVPIGRLMPEDLYTIGRTSEITREELSFSRHIVRLRRKFAEGVLGEALGRQLILKGIMSPEDWDQIKHEIKYEWARDNFSAELMEREMMLSRCDALDRMMPYVGRFFSNEQIRRDVLKQDDEKIEEIDKQIDEEADDPQYPPPGAEGAQPPDGLVPPPGDSGPGAGEDLSGPENMPKAPAAPKGPPKPK